MCEWQMVTSSSIQNSKSMGPQEGEFGYSPVRIHHGQAISNTDSSVMTQTQERQSSGTTTPMTIPLPGGTIGIHPNMETRNR
jgi:hypothetical protein